MTGSLANGTSRAEVMRPLIGCSPPQKIIPKTTSSHLLFFLLFLFLCYPASDLLEKDKYQYSNSNIHPLHQHLLFHPPPYFTSMCQSAPSFPSSALLLPAGCLANSACCYSDFPPASLTPIDVDSEIDLGSAVADLSPRRTRVSSLSSKAPRLLLDSFGGDTIWVGVLGPS